MGELGHEGVAVPAAWCAEMRRQGYRRVILLGTARDMQGSRLKVPLAKAGMLVLVPGAPDRAWLDRVITDELRRDGATDETTARFARLLADGAEHGVDAVMVTCAELGELCRRAGLGLPVVDLSAAGTSACDRATNREGRA